MAVESVNIAGPMVARRIHAYHFHPLSSVAKNLSFAVSK
jgi:hypothetical protein